MTTPPPAASIYLATDQAALPRCHTNCVRTSRTWEAAGEGRSAAGYRVLEETL